MGTKIEWATETWNPVTGCTPISEGCQNCYAKRMANRLRGRYGYSEDDPFRVVMHSEEVLDRPYKWRKPRRIFCCSMGDLFHVDVPDYWISVVRKRALQNIRHTFLFLTKRPERLLAWTQTTAKRRLVSVRAVWPTNAWLGVTAENQRCVDERIPILFQTPAAVRFVSVEPMLESVDLNPCNECQVNLSQCKEHNKLGWVIAGAETGPGARPCNPDWFRSLRDQCQEAGVPFFLKKINAKGDRELDGQIWEQYPPSKGEDSHQPEARVFEPAFPRTDSTSAKE